MKRMEISVPKSASLYRKLALALLCIFSIACSFPFSTVDSSMKNILIGKWIANRRPFTNATLEFKSDGTLVIGDATTNQLRATLNYRFIQENEIEITGTREFQSTATLEFRGDKLCSTFIFEGNVFGEIYPCMTRIE